MSGRSPRKFMIAHLIVLVSLAAVGMRLDSALGRDTVPIYFRLWSILLSGQAVAVAWAVLALAGTW
jgi:hypothetical protein